MQTCVILNPSARGEKARRICAGLNKFSHDWECRFTTKPGHARELAAQAVRDGFKTIIAGGGDGTVNEVINGLADVPAGLEKTAFGVLPLGTVNVFARELALPLRLEKAAKVLQARKVQAIDVGCAEYTAGGNLERRLFVQLAGAGLDSRAIELLSWGLKKKIGAASYVVAGCQALFERQPVINARGDDSLSGELVLVGNGRFYGGSFPVFPKASLQDGLLDVFVMPKVNFFRAVAAGVGIATGRVSGFCAASRFASHSVKLSSDHRVLFQLDGENIGQLPATLSIRPKALQVIVP